MFDVNVGKRIRAIRRRLGLTQAQFGRGLGIISVSVARYEGGRIPRADVLDRIARLAGTTSTRILHGDQKDTKATAESKIAGSAFPKHIRELVALLEPDWTSEPWARIPEQIRRRYKRRAREATAQLKRQLEEYRLFLGMGEQCRRKTHHRE